MLILQNSLNDIQQGLYVEGGPQLNAYFWSQYPGVDGGSLGGDGKDIKF
jgi:hypothetical protein